MWWSCHTTAELGYGRPQSVIGLHIVYVLLVFFCVQTQQTHTHEIQSQDFHNMRAYFHYLCSRYKRLQQQKLCYKHEQYCWFHFLLVCEVITRYWSYHWKGTKMQSTSKRSTKCVTEDYGCELSMLCVMMDLWWSVNWVGCYEQWTARQLNHTHLFYWNSLDGFKIPEMT